MITHTSDHELLISGQNGDNPIRLELAKDEAGRPLYRQYEKVPQYDEHFEWTQSDWRGGHGQYNLVVKSMYFDGQSIDTTQEGRILLGPKIYAVYKATTGAVDYYITNDDNKVAVTEGYPAGQTFTTSTDYTVSAVSLKLYRSGYPGTVTVSIQSTSGGLPTGTVLAYGMINGNDITESTSGAWYMVNFITPVALTSGTVYAIVASVESTQTVYWKVDASSPGYTDGDSLSYGFQDSNAVLIEDISQSDTVMDVNDVSHFSDGTVVKIDDEQMTVTDVTDWEFTWTKNSVPSDVNGWESVCWSPKLELFCAVGTATTGYRVMTSPDGATWTGRTAPIQSLYAVCWSPELELFCAVAAYGSGNRVMTSPDGVNWTSRTSAADNEWRSVCWSAKLGLFCAVASSGVGNRVMTSPDGITWTARPSAADNGWYSVCWSPELELFCAVALSGTGDRVMTSPDGINWTLRASASDDCWCSVCWSAERNLFCAVATNGNAVMTSPDGVNWTARSAPSNSWLSVCWSPELHIFFAVTNTGSSRVMTSPDGITWTSRFLGQEDDWESVCWSPILGAFCAVPAHSLSPNHYAGICHPTCPTITVTRADNGTSAATHTSGTTVYHLDWQTDSAKDAMFATYSLGSTAFDSTPHHFLWSRTIGKLLCATSGKIYYYDGANWIAASTTVAGVTDLKEYNGVIYAAVGASNYYYYSTDGNAWTLTDLTDGYANKFLVAPNEEGTQDVLWKFKTPNEVSCTTDGRRGSVGGVEWTTPNYVGDTTSNITNLFLLNNELMIGREDNLYNLEYNGGIRALMDELRNARSVENFKYVCNWQSGAYFSIGNGVGELIGQSPGVFSRVGPLDETEDLDKVGVVRGIASDTDYLYVAMLEGDVTHIYKGKPRFTGNDYVWEWCPWVYLGTNQCEVIYVAQHSQTDRRLWFGYGLGAGYVRISDNPTADDNARFAPSGWIRMSYIQGNNPYWDKMVQSLTIQTDSCATGQTVNPIYRKDTDTDMGDLLASPITTNGILKHNLASGLSGKRWQFGLELATDNPTLTPQVRSFTARGTEKPESFRVHDATYIVRTQAGTHPSTVLNWLKAARTTNSLVRFSDLRLLPPTSRATAGTNGTDYVNVCILPGYPEVTNVTFNRLQEPEFLIHVVMTEVNDT